MTPPRFCLILMLGRLVASVSEQDLDLERDRLYGFISEAIVSSPQDLFFDSLSEAELNDFWSDDDGLTVTDTIRRLKDKFETTIFVEVKLVGFAGDGKLGLQLSESELLRYLESSRAADITPHVLNAKV